MSIKLKLDGFNELIKEVEKASGNVDSATKKCVEKGAGILQDELKSKMQTTGVDSGLISRMPAPEVESDYGLYTARVGYKKGAYNPKNLSDGYKAVFLNYGTPSRKKHGQVKARKFISKAKSAARRKIKSDQEKTFKEILRGLK